jgi:YesN/AraC family two-component response regulator
MPMKILICDDHKIVREGLRQILQQLSDEALIEEASNSDEAFPLLKKDAFDIVLLDISLPGLNGIDILQIVKEKLPVGKNISQHRWKQLSYNKLPMINLQRSTIHFRAVSLRS